jgi:ribonuclease HI
VYVEVFVDGASRGQGQKKLGEAACAAVIYKNKKRIAHYARGIGKRTNNEAEYEAVILALLMCAMADLPDPTIYSDSAVVVNQINRRWDCKNPSLLPLLMSIRDIQEEFRFKVEQVPRRMVAVADELCNEFLDNLQAESRLLIPKKNLTI